MRIPGNRARFLLCLGLVGLCLAGGLVYQNPRRQPPGIALRTAERERIEAAYGKLPLSFEINQGQADDQVKFLSRGSGYTLLLTSTEAVLQPRSASSVRMKLVGANSRAEPSGLEPLPGKVNYLLGNDPQKWQTNVPTFARAQFRDVYPGVDVVYYGQQRQLEYDFVISPGGSSQSITLGFEGAEEIELDRDGDLVLRSGEGQIRHRKPIIYQEIDGAKQTISGGYLRRGANEVGFQVGSYNPDYPLVIDPTLVYSSYLGGGGGEIAFGVAVDAAGSAYVTGATISTDFPTTPGAYQRENRGGGDVFVSKLNPAGNALVYSTLIGSDGADVARGIAVDSAGNALIVGDTTSRTFPLVNPLQANYGGGVADAFVVKLNPTGSALVYSTYLGGDGEEYGNGIASDGAGNAYVAGFTTARNFPLANALQSTFGGGTIDAFVAKLNATGSTLAYSTYLGGGRDDFGLGIAADSTGNAYVTGATDSTNYPLEKPLQATNRGNFDVVLTKINPTGSAFVYSTYFGGSHDEFGRGVAVDTGGFAFVTGDTTSSNFPTSSPAQPAFGGGNFDAFVFRLGPTGGGPLYSTYLGGGGSADRGDDIGSAIAVDSQGQAYVTGYTRSNIFPLANSMRMAAGLTDVFVTKLNPAGVPVVYSTYLGGGGEDQANSIAVDASGNAYVAGFTTSSDFPIASPLQGSISGAQDSFVAKLSADQRDMGLRAVSAASYSSAPIAVESIAASFGVGMTAAAQAATTTPLPTSLAGTTLSLNGKLVPLFYVSPAQINFEVPPGTNTATGAFTLTNQGAIIGAGIVQIVNVSPGLFAANGNGQGVAAAVALRVRADGSQTYEPVARFDAAQNRFIPTPIDLGPETDQVFLVLFGTGIRFRSSLSAVVTGIGGVDAQVTYAGAVGDSVGLDQVNARIPRSLVGRGEVDVTLTVDGIAAGKVTVGVK